jgi:hypothetical protein
VENLSVKPCLAKYSKQILKTLLILSIAMYFLHVFFYANTTLLQAQVSPKVLWVSRVPDNGTVWFISYALIENELVLYTISSGGIITFLRLSNGEILRYVKLKATPIFALPIPYLHGSSSFMTTDIVVGVASSLLRISSVNGSTMWVVNLSSQVVSGAIVGDVDSDGIWDIIAGDSQGNVYLVSSSSGKIMWFSRTYYSAPNIIGIAGFYVYSGSSSSEFAVTAFKPDGSWKWVNLGNLAGISNPQVYASYIDVVVDVNGDGYKDVVVATDSSIVMLDSRSGSALWTKPMSLRPHIVSRTLNDCDGDGLYDIVVGTENGVYILSSASGTVIWSRPIGYVFSIDNFYWRDLNKDGYTEIIVATSKGIYMLSGRNGEIIWLYEPGSLATSVEWSWIQGSEQDIDGDKNPDPLAGTSNGYIIALSASNLVTTTSPTVTIITEPITPAPINTTVTKTVTITSAQTVSITIARLYTTISTTTVFTTTPLTITLTSPYTTTFTQFVPTTITTTLHKIETQTLTTTTTIPTTITTTTTAFKTVTTTATLPVTTTVTVVQPPTTYTITKIVTSTVPESTLTITMRPLFSEDFIALAISVAMIITSTAIGLRLRRR